MFIVLSVLCDAIVCFTEYDVEQINKHDNKDDY